MPTLFEQIDAGLSGNDLGERLTSQVNKLTAIGGTANNLFQNPPAAINQLIQSLGSLPLPNTNKLGALPQTITNLQSLMPADLSGVTGKLTSGLADLSVQADGAIVSKLSALTNSLKALYGFLQIITGLPSANGGTGGNGGVGPELTPAAAVKTEAINGEAGNSTAVNSPAANSAAAKTQPTAARQAVAATATGEINGIIQALDRLPDPLNVESFLEGLNFLLNGFNRSLFPMAHLPFTDELAQTLNTLWQWRDMTGGQIAGHLETTLQTTATFIGGRLDGEIQPIVNLANTLNSQFDAATLQNVCQNLHQELQTLAQAVVDVDLPLINTTLAGLNALRTQFNAILSGLMTNFFSGQAPELLERLNSFHDRADASLCNLLTSLNPATDIGLLETLSARINAAYNPDEIDRSLAGYRELFTWLRGLLDQIDLSSIEEPVSTAASTLQGAVADLDNLLVEVITGVSLLFDDVEAVIDQVDTAGIAAAIKAAVEKFQQQVQGQIDKLFSPIKSAITTGINTINSAVGDFDPQDIIDALRQAIQTLTGVLSNPQVLGAIKGVRGQLDGMTAQLGTISFKPANDVIIGQIDEVKGILQAMDTSLLNNALKLALMAAVDLLPGEDDLKGVKSDLLAELDQLITSGPATLLVSVQVQPEQLLVKVRAYSPLVLVGDALAVPFQQVLKQLQGFHPSDLLKPVQAGLDQVKKTLEQKANPGQFIAPLEGPFADLLSLFDQLQPQQLVAPLNQALEQVLSAIIEALPVDELFEIFDAVLSRLQMVVDTVGALRTLFHRGQALLAGFEEPETQLTTWIDSIIDRLDQVPDTTNLTLVFSQVAEAIADLQSAPILDRLLVPLQPLRQSLASLTPQACLTGLIRDFRDFPQGAVAGLPHPERQNIENFFATFDPRQPDIIRPLNSLQDLADRLQPFPQIITEAFAGWDADYHGPASYLSGLVPSDTSIPAVKSLLRATIQAEVGQPLTVILSLLPNLSQMVEGFLQIFDEFAADIEAKMSILVGGPASLTTIRQSMGKLVDTIQGLNFNFLATELEGVFTNVKTKFNAISPAVLRGIVEEAFTAALANLDLAQLLPAAEVSALDSEFAALITEVSQLDPHKLVVEVMQPEFESTIKPLLEPFDLTGVITAIIGEMDRLKVDLSTELDRTIAAFLAMLDAVPSLELSLDVDIGVDIGF